MCVKTKFLQFPFWKTCFPLCSAGQGPLIARSQPAANHSNTHCTPGLQRRTNYSSGPLNPLIWSSQTIKEDVQQLHNQSIGREERICPLAWENWSLCNKTDSSSTIIFSAPSIPGHKSGCEEEQLWRNLCRRKKPQPSVTFSSTRARGWGAVPGPLPALCGLHVMLLPPTSKELLSHSSLNTSRMGLRGSLWWVLGKWKIQQPLTALRSTVPV